MFLWNKENVGNCKVTTVRHGLVNTMERPLMEKKCDTFIRFNEAVSIIKKIKELII